MANEVNSAENLPKENKGGRPKGSVNINSRAAFKKLEELGFDPIAEMIKLYEETSEELRLMRKQEGRYKGQKPSLIAQSNLEGIKQKCINDLMRYGYARSTEATEIMNNQTEPMQIVLTKAKPKAPTDGTLLSIPEA